MGGGGGLSNSWNINHWNTINQYQMGRAAMAPMEPHKVDSGWGQKDLQKTRKQLIIFVSQTDF
jgi:hypothetical protein